MLLLLRSGPVSLVKCSLGTAKDRVRASWKATLELDICVAMPPVTLVLADGVVDKAGLFDGLASCCGDSGMSDAVSVVSAPKVTVDTMSG